MEKKGIFGFFRRSLRNKILVIFLLITLVPLGILNFINYQTLKGQIRADLERRLILGRQIDLKRVRGKQSSEFRDKPFDRRAGVRKVPQNEFLEIRGCLGNMPEIPQILFRGLAAPCLFDRLCPFGRILLRSQNSI